MKSLFSLFVVMCGLFTLVITKIEMRRMGYEVLQLQKKYKSSIDENRLLKVQWAQNIRPEFVRAYAQTKLTLDFARSDQIIYLTKSGQVQGARD